jgi:hypothetical protein
MDLTHKNGDQRKMHDELCGLAEGQLYLYIYLYFLVNRVDVVRNSLGWAGL